LKYGYFETTFLEKNYKGLFYKGLTVENTPAYCGEESKTAAE